MFVGEIGVGHDPNYGNGLFRCYYGNFLECWLWDDSDIRNRVLRGDYRHVSKCGVRHGADYGSRVVWLVECYGGA